MSRTGRKAVEYWEELTRLDQFDITAEHLTLLQRGNVSWFYVGEWTGSPGLDMKRPFGDSDIWESIAEAVDGPFLNAMGEGAREDFVEANADRWERLHAEVGIALQISLDTGQFSTGRYRKLQPGDARYPMNLWAKVDGQSSS